MRQLTVGSALFVTGGGGEVAVASMDRVEAAARNVDDMPSASDGPRRNCDAIRERRGEHLL